jgi:peptidoglycan biosynthesis protein MviN/MurJ (putative lipid II flippase)
VAEDTRAPPSAGARHAGNAAITAVLQLGTMAIGAVIALLILHLFGKDDRTDGLLAAYSVYGLLMVLGQTFRTTVVPRLAEGGFGVELDRYVGGALVLAVLAAVPLVLLAGPAAAVMTGDPAAEDAARSALMILWGAAALQLVAGVLAAALAEQGSFVAPGAGYLAGGPVAVLLVVLFEPALGTDSVALALALGSILTVAVMAVRLVQLGWRPTVHGLRPRRGRIGRVLSAMVLGAVATVIGQLLYVVSTAFAARIETGAVTLYSYAFFGSLLLAGMTSVPAQVVLAGPIARGWDGRPQSLERDALAVVRTGLIILAPALALAAAIGTEVFHGIFSESLSRADARVIIACLVVLGFNVVAAVAQTVPLLAAFAHARYALVGRVAAAAAVIHIALSLVALSTGRLVSLAVATVVTNGIATVLLCRAVYGREARRTLTLLGAEIARLTAVGAAAFVPPLLLSAWIDGPTLLLALAGWAVGCVLFLLALRRHEPWQELVGRLARVVRVPRSA